MFACPAPGLAVRDRRYHRGVLRRLAFLAVSLAAASIALGLVFAGSPTTIANGVRIDGVDVGGLEATAARRLLERRSARLAERPIVFTAAGQRFPISPSALGVEPNWKAAIDSAQRQGDGFAPWRGIKRLDVTFFGADVTPPTAVLNGSLQYELGQIARSGRSAPAGCCARPPRVDDRRRARPGRIQARPRRGRSPARPRARVARPVVGSGRPPVADAAAARPRRRARPCCRPGAPCALRPREARARRDAVGRAALPPRAAHRAPVRRAQVTPDRRTRGGRVAAASRQARRQACEGRDLRGRREARPRRARDSRASGSTRSPAGTRS